MGNIRSRVVKNSVALKILKPEAKPNRQPWESVHPLATPLAESVIATIELPF